MKEDPIMVPDPVGLHTLQVIAHAGKFNRWMFGEFRDMLKGEVLEIGSGIGNISRLVIDTGARVTLSDINPGYIATLKKNFSGLPNVSDILPIDLLHPDFENEYSSLKEKFDSIFLLNVIEHLADDARAIQNCKFILRHQGHLIILAPAYQWLFCKLDRELGHYRRYRLKTMESLLTRHGLEIRRKQYFNFAGMAGWLVFGKLFQRKKLGGGEMSTFNTLVPLARWADLLLNKKTGLSIIVTAIKNKS